MFKNDKEQKENMKNVLDEDISNQEEQSILDNKEEQLEVDGATPSLPVTDLDDESLDFDDNRASLPITEPEDENVSTAESDLPPSSEPSSEEAKSKAKEEPKAEDNRTEEEKIEDALKEEGVSLRLGKNEIDALASIRNTASKVGKVLDEKAKEEAVLEAQKAQKTGGGGGFSFPKIFGKEKKPNLHPSKILDAQAIKLSKNYHGLVRSEQEVLRHRNEFNNAISLERTRNSAFDTRMKTLEAFKVANKLPNNADAIDLMSKSSDPRARNVVKELNRDIKESKYLNSAYTDMKKSLSNYELNSNSVAKGAEKLMKNGVDVFAEDQLKTLYDNAMERNQKLQKEMADQELKSKKDKSFQDKLKEIGNNFSSMFNSLIEAVQKFTGLGMKK